VAKNLQLTQARALTPAPTRSSPRGQSTCAPPRLPRRSAPPWTPARTPAVARQQITETQARKLAARGRLRTQEGAPATTRGRMTAEEIAASWARTGAGAPRLAVSMPVKAFQDQGAGPGYLYQARPTCFSQDIATANGLSPLFISASIPSRSFMVSFAETASSALIAGARMPGL
jgi:hypothetical protein